MNYKELNIEELIDNFRRASSKNTPHYIELRKELVTRLTASIPVITEINSLSKDLHKNFKSMRTKGINLGLISARVDDKSLEVVSKEIYKDIDNQEAILGKIDKILENRIKEIK